MKTALVTGATGFIGSNLVPELLRQGYSVRVFYRKNSDAGSFAGLDVEPIIGDILDQESLRHAVKGCDFVFHTAAVVSFWKGRTIEQSLVNVQGSRNIVNACLKSVSCTLVHTSSVAAIGYNTDRSLSDENTPYNWGTANTYRYTKHLAELEILDGIRKGLSAVIVNPSIVIGPGDRRAHGGRLIIDVKRGRIPFYTDGGTNIVSVHDVINGHLLAADRGRTGERYILSGCNYTHRELLQLIASLVKGRKSLIKIPSPVVLFAGKLFDLAGAVTKREPPLNSELTRSIIHHNWYSCDKAVRELGYHPTSIEPAITDAYEWYRQHGMLD